MWTDASKMPAFESQDKGRDKKHGTISDWVEALVPHHFKNVFRVSIIFTALVQVWINRNMMNAMDSVSYLDMADGMWVRQTARLRECVLVAIVSFDTGSTSAPL